MIISAQYTNSGRKTVKVVLDDGMIWFMPQPCETWHKEVLDKFIADGGTIQEPV